MGLDAGAIKTGLDAHCCEANSRIARALELAGYPEPRLRPTGYATLLRTIVGQQVSVAAAASVWRKLEAHLGEDIAPEALLASHFDELRACGLSRQKQGYARSLCELVVTGELEPRWFACGRRGGDCRAGADQGHRALVGRDLPAVRRGAARHLACGRPCRAGGLHKLLGLDARPSEKETRALAEAWRPHRGAAAIFTWHVYNNPAL